MKAWYSLADRVLTQCDHLSTLSQSPDCIDRRYLTEQHANTNQQVAQWMADAGMRTWQDEAGNQWGSYVSEVPGAKTLILGSHLDTVPNSGKYDGILGVLAPIALISALHAENVRLPFNIDVVGFGDEEGTRFGTTLLGSRAVAGTWQDKWATVKDRQNICLAQAMREFGLDINKVHNAARAAEGLLGFVELHIEQGPVLEAQQLPVGVVSGIAGAQRFQLTLNGSAGHAGTVPMAMRRDALAGAAEMVLAIEQVAQHPDLVATVGKLECAPNAVNVIAGHVQFSLDIRSLDDALLAEQTEKLLTRLQDIASRRQLALSVAPTHSAPAVSCDESLQHALQQAIQNNHLRPFTLPSGAGHDAMAMASVCPVAMLFMRCEGGISHHPAEAVSAQDVAVALQVLNRFILQLADAQQPALSACS